MLPPLLVVLVTLASCAPQRLSTQPTPPPASAPANAVAAGVAAGPAIQGLEPRQLDRVRDAFLITCPALTRRPDRSGLTRPEDWAGPCASLGPGHGPLLEIFQQNFELVEVGGGQSLVTGYYEPEIAGARTHLPGYDVPVYARPDDLVEVDEATAAKTGSLRRGRFENGVLIPYYERGEIEDGVLANRGLEIGWAADPVALFFLEIQGSGRLRLPDGNVMRIGYAGQNGRDYVGIGRLMRDRGLLEPGKTTMQDIVAWLHDHPQEGRALMRENKSYIFFKELTGPGPIGALGYPVTPQATVAADPSFVPLGAPILLAVDRPEANGIWIAQDTGGAIRGANRFDTFWGAGEQAALTAGGMQARGRAWIFVPKGTLARLRAQAQP